jgi:spore coat polysaccharide biosynthesis protein SpsF
MRNVAIIQARMGSRRFPGKILADLAGEPLLARVVERTRLAQRLDHIVVATSESSSDDPVVDLCRRRSWDVFRGDEHDVLGRFVSAARFGRADRVVRITADCPLIDGRLIDLALRQFDASPELDYLSTVIDHGVVPAGFDVEILATTTLHELARDVRRTWWREHVTLYIRQYPDQFRTQLLRLDDEPTDEPADAVDWPLSVDTPDDLERVRAIFQRLPTPNFSWREALQVARALASSQGPAADIQPRWPTRRTGQAQPRPSYSTAHRTDALVRTWGRSDGDIRCEYGKTVRDMVNAAIKVCPSQPLLRLGPRVRDTWRLNNSAEQDVPPSEVFRAFERARTVDAGFSDNGFGASSERRPTLLTVNRLGRIPTAEPFLEWLRGWPIRPASVIHFEPCWLPRRYGADGARRNRWIVHRDGCRDLVMLLQSAPDIVVEQSELDCISSSSGRAFHLLVWHFIGSRDGNRYTDGTLGFHSLMNSRGFTGGIPLRNRAIRGGKLNP